MSRLMSVSLTEASVRDRTKTVTRRLGWRFLKVGDRLTLCRKVMGRKPGEPLVRIAWVEVVDVHRESLSDITAADVAREGFPEWTPGQFIEFYGREMGLSWDDRVRGIDVTRIEWRYLDDADQPGSSSRPCRSGL